MKVRAGDRGMIPFAAVFIVLIGLAILAPIVAPYSPDDQDLVKRFMPPLTPGHSLGTDHLGRDILTRLIFGTRISLSVGSIAVFISVLFGTVLGILSGYYGGMFDDIVNWFVNVQLAFPFILLAISVIAVLGPSLVNMIIVLAIGGWPAYVRVVRSKVFVLKEVEYVEAVKAIGAGDARIMLRHIFPNVAPPLIVLTSFEFAKMVIAEAALSFLGLGPSGLDYSSWGLMLAEGKNYLAVAWWVATIPGLAIMTAVLSINIVGDWLRDRLDPKLQT
ncbi:MAG: ABC transporter permease [Caldilineaceae bacterium]|nr:ABC transporter permease [Caldilineaceae bacterium]